MFVESIRFKRTEDSDWEEGYYIGATDYSYKSIIIDKNYVPLERNEKGFVCWDYYPNVNNWKQFRCDDNFEED